MHDLDRACTSIFAMAHASMRNVLSGSGGTATVYVVCYVVYCAFRAKPGPYNTVPLRVIASFPFSMAS